MSNLKDHFFTHGKSFDSYNKWLAEASPEELLAGGVSSGMLIDLYGTGNENTSKYMLKTNNYLCGNGFTLGSEGHRSCRYSFDRNKTLHLSLSGEFAVSMMILSDSSSQHDLELTKDISQVVSGIIGFIQGEKISARILPSFISAYSYTITNYVFDSNGLRIFQTEYY